MEWLRERERELVGWYMGRLGGWDREKVRRDGGIERKREGR